MGFIRIGTGRDAADVSFATIFGAFQSAAPLIEIRAEAGTLPGFELPVRRPWAISTAA